LAKAARDRIFRSFTNADATSAAVPFELARVEDCSRPEERSGNEPATNEPLPFLNLPDDLVIQDGDTVWKGSGGDEIQPRR
jgi:hypothetical protein